ncbi:MAG: diguanylate cyclase [Desulfarculaceae bacterium]
MNKITFQRMRSLSVGVKISAALVLVVLVTSLVLITVVNTLAVRFVEKHSRLQMQEQLMLVDGIVAMLLETSVVDPKNALSEAVAQINNRFKHDLASIIYAVMPDGAVILPPTFSKSDLPGQDVLIRIARAGRGQTEFQVDNQEYWAAFDRRAKGEMVLVIQCSREAMVGEVLGTLIWGAVLAALCLGAVVALLAMLFFRRVIAAPLMLLTEDGERVASGDLTPPKPFANRYDELGRLSRVLNHMAITAQQMVEEARANQARFQQLFTDSRDATFIINEQGRIEDVNPAAVKIFGYANKTQMQALEETNCLFSNQEERRLYLNTLKAQGYVQDFPVTLRRNSGEEFEGLITATLRGEKQARFGLVRDVTQMRSAQRALRESEDRYRRLLENAPDLIFRWSLHSDKFDYLSPALVNLTGYEPQQVMESPVILKNAIHPDYREKVLALRKDLIAGMGPSSYEVEYQSIHASGGTRWVRERSILIRDEMGQPTAIEGLATDITVAKRLEQALIQGQQMVEATLQGLPAPVMVIDRRHKVVHWNRAMEIITGVKAKDRVGTSLQWNPFHKNQRPVLADLVLDMDWRAIDKLYGASGLKKSILVEGGVEFEAFLKDLGGKSRHLRFLAAPITDENNQVVRAVETLIDLTDIKALEEELRRLSVTDDLTGLYNQRFFYATLAREVETSRRYNQPLALLLMDLDEFKKYNDSFGHLEGDRVLSACAKTVQQKVRSTDLPCRYGGEEFVVLLPHSDLDEAEAVAERIRDGIERLQFFPALPGKGPTKAKVTTSVGVALLQAGVSKEDLVRRADQAMYEAKKEGRNRVATLREDGQIVVLPQRVSAKAS